MSSFTPANVQWSVGAQRAKQLLEWRPKLTDAPVASAVQLDTQRGFEAMVEVIGLDGSTEQVYVEIAPNWGEVAAGFSVPAFAKAAEEYKSVWEKMFLLSVMQRNAQGDYDTDHQWEPPRCPTTYRDNPDHWIKQEALRKQFWPSANNLAKIAGFKKVPEQRKWIHDTLGIERMESFNGSMDEALRILKTASDAASQPAPAEPPAETAQTNDDLKNFLKAVKLAYEAIAPDITKETLRAWFAEDVGCSPDEVLTKFSAHDAMQKVQAGIAKRKQAAAANNQPPADPDPDPEPPSEDAETEPPPAEAMTTTDHYSVDIKMPVVAAFTTLTGVAVADIEKRLDAKYVLDAYKVIEMKGGKAGTDISQDYVRDRFVEVFGIQGIGWRFTISPVGGVSSTKHTYMKPGYKDKPAKEITEFHISLIAHIFEYRIVNNGIMEWVQLSPMSDSHIDEDEGYAFRGAETSLMKHVLRSMGGFNHLYRNKRLHTWATKELAKIKAQRRN